MEGGIESPQYMDEFNIRAALKAIRMDYPFVQGAKTYLDSDERYKDYIFLSLYIDITMISKEYDCPIMSFVKYNMSHEKKDYEAVYIKTFFDQKGKGYGLISDLTDLIQNDFGRVYKSDIIPQEMRLKKQSMILDYVARVDHQKYPELIKYDYNSPF